MQSASDGFQERLSSIRAIMEEKKLTAIVLRRNPNLAWLLAGRVHVPTTIDAACLDLIITASRVTAITNVIEAPRLIAEELPSEVEVISIPWWEGRDPKLPTGEEVGSDQPGAGRIDLGVEIEMARSSLTEFDRHRYHIISEDSARALGEVMKSIARDDRETDVAGCIANALWAANLEIAFLGVAGQRRAQLFRHPLPTEDGIGNRVVASICAKRKGLIASVTRILSFEPWSDRYESEYLGLLNVEASILDATSVGAAFSSPVAAASTSYALNGFEESEWHRHHQGGPTGYLPRDWPATPTSSRSISMHQPVAWNPTGKGWKVEDTWITTANGPELLSIDPNWPSRIVSGRPRPEVLSRI